MKNMVCKPVDSSQSGNWPELDNWSSSERMENGEGVRCRFLTRKNKSFDVPASVGRGPLIQCMCNDDVVEDMASVEVLWGKDNQVHCEAVESFDRSEAATTSSAAAGIGDGVSSTTSPSIIKQLSFLDRYLAVWIIMVMVIGVLVGKYAPRIKKAWNVAKIEDVSLPIAIGLWLMMYPVLCKVRYELMGSLLRSRELLRHIGLSLVLNWVVGPALMTGLAWATLPDLDGYRNGVIMVGLARCIAMVLIWNHLAGGNAEFCAILVAVNSVLQIALYAPFALFYLNVISGSSGLDVGFWTIAKSVLLFLGIPLGAAIVTRYGLRFTAGPKWYDTKFVPLVGPLALLSLLFTIFVMFSLQGDKILNNFTDVLRVSVPMLLYFAIFFSSSFLICRLLRIPYPDTVTQCFTASSNNFELAIAVAVGSFGINSDEALAAVVGPLIEVPVLVALVYVALWLEKKISWPTEGSLGNILELPPDKE
eukprot:jgi/Mesen1/7825/ME000417S07137